MLLNPYEIKALISFTDYIFSNQGRKTSLRYTGWLEKRLFDNYSKLFHELASRVIPICKRGGLSRNMQLLKRFRDLSRHVLDLY